jgi:hypothetical protein
VSEDIDLEEIEVDQVGVMGPIHVFVGCMFVSLEIACCSQSLIDRAIAIFFLSPIGLLSLCAAFFYFGKECGLLFGVLG